MAFDATVLEHFRKQPFAELFLPVLDSRLPVTNVERSVRTTSPSCVEVNVQTPSPRLSADPRNELSTVHENRAIDGLTLHA